MPKFSENDLLDKFDAKNDKTGEQIIIFHHSKLSEDKKIITMNLLMVMAES